MNHSLDMSGPMTITSTDPLGDFVIAFRGEWKLRRIGPNWRLLRGKCISRSWPGSMPPLRALSHALHHIATITQEATTHDRA